MDVHERAMAWLSFGIFCLIVLLSGTFVYHTLTFPKHSDEIPASFIDGKRPILREQMKRCHGKGGIVFLDDQEKYAGCLLPETPCEIDCKV